MQAQGRADSCAPPSATTRRSWASTASSRAAASAATRTAGPATPTRARASRPAASSSSCTASRCSRRSPATRSGPTAARRSRSTRFPAALTPDLKGLHYLTCANQVQLDRENKAPGDPERRHDVLLQPVRALPLLPAQRLARLALLRRGTLAGHGGQRPVRLALRRQRGQREGRRRARA